MSASITQVPQFGTETADAGTSTCTPAYQDNDVSIDDVFRRACAIRGLDPGATRHREVLTARVARQIAKQIVGPWPGARGDRPLKQSIRAVPATIAEIAWATVPGKCRNRRPHGTRPGVSVECGQRHCSLCCYRRHGQGVFEEIVADLGIYEMLDGRWKYIWVTVKVRTAGFLGLDQLKAARTPLRRFLTRLEKRYPLLGAGWGLDWTPPFLGEGSYPHDQWLISVPPGVDPETVGPEISAAVRDIARRGGIDLWPVWWKPVDDIVAALGYATGARKKCRKITLPPESPRGTVIRSFDLAGLVSNTPGFPEDGTEVDGNRFDYLRARRRKGWATDAERSELRWMERNLASGGHTIVRGVPYVPTADTVRGILTLFDPFSISRYDGRRAIRCPVKDAIRRASAMHYHDVHVGPHRERRREAYVGEPLSAFPASHVFAVYLEIFDDEGDAQAEHLIDLLREHAERPVHVRLSGGKTAGHWHRQVFVIGFDDPAHEAWREVVNAMRLSPSCARFTVGQEMLVPSSPSMWRREAALRRPDGRTFVVYLVDDRRISLWYFDYEALGRNARTYADDPARYEGAGLPPKETLLAAKLSNLKARAEALEQELATTADMYCDASRRSRARLDELGARREAELEEVKRAIESLRLDRCLQSSDRARRRTGV
jgi:hypothetical protein